MDVKELKASLEYKNKNVFDSISEDERAILYRSLAAIQTNLQRICEDYS